MKKKQTAIEKALQSFDDDRVAQQAKQDELDAQAMEKYQADLQDHNTHLGRMKELSEGLCLAIQQRFRLLHPVSPLVIDLAMKGESQKAKDNASGCYAVYSETAQTDVAALWISARLADKILDDDEATIKQFIEAAARTVEDFPELIAQQQPAPEPPGEETPAPVAPIAPGVDDENPGIPV